MKLKRVRKRDGREVPFDVTKIETAVGKALAAVGEEDDAFAAEVAALVRMTLEARGSEGQVPNIEDIQDLVEQALIELGRARIAKAYILYRDRRTRVRAALRVDVRTDAHLPEAEPAAAAEGARRGGRVRVLESEGTSPWSKGRIVAALMNEADLERALAEEVAGRVERRVFDAGWSRVSTALIRELVDNELVDLGLEAQLRRQGSVGWPRHDLRQLFTNSWIHAPLPGAPAPSGLDVHVGQHVLRRFALEEIVPAEIAEAHLSGDLELIGIEAPHQYLTAGLPADLLLGDEPSVEAAFALLSELSASSALVSRGVVLEDPGRALAPLARGSAGSGLLGAWLAALGALARATGRRFDLGTPGPRNTVLLRRLIEELARTPSQLRGPWTPRLHLDAGELLAFTDAHPDQRELCEELCGRGSIIPTWSTERERFAAPGARRTARERAAVLCGGAVGLNLPRLARRAGPWCEDRMLESLSELVAIACRALGALRAFQERARPARAGRTTSSELRGRVMGALCPVGLREALQILGDGEMRPEQGARLVGFIADAGRRFGAERRLSVLPTAFFGERAATRFAELDAARNKTEQRLLFSDIGPGPLAAMSALGQGRREARHPGAVTSYRPGLRISASALPSAADIEIARTVSAGALYPPAAELGSYLDLSATTHGDIGTCWRAFLAAHGDPVDAQDRAACEAGRGAGRETESDAPALFDATSPSSIASEPS